MVNRGGTDGRTDGRTDVSKFPPVFYRTLALWGCCPKKRECREIDNEEANLRRNRTKNILKRTEQTETESEFPWEFSSSLRETRKDHTKEREVERNKDRKIVKKKKETKKPKKQKTKKQYKGKEKTYKNKAGYTANTSRGRVGMGGNACFPTFRLERDGPTNQPTNRPTNRRTDGRTKPLIESLVRD